MNIKSKVLGLAGAVCLSIASATAFGSGAAGPLQFTDIQVNGATTYVSLTAVPGGKPACGTSTQYSITGTVDFVRALTGAATSAHLAAKTVGITFDGTCDGTLAKISSIRIY
ncbi:MAG: hypothetical protein QM756_01770 [Polyangiaceae bacterium]